MARHKSVELSPAKSSVDNDPSTESTEGTPRQSNRYSLPAIGTMFRFLRFQPSPPKQTTTTESQESQRSEEDISSNTATAGVPVGDGDEVNNTEEDEEPSGFTRNLRSRRIVVASPAAQTPKEMAKKRKPVGRPRKDKNQPALGSTARRKKDTYDVPSDEEHAIQEENMHARKPSKRAKLNPNANHLNPPPRSRSRTPSLRNSENAELLQQENTRAVGLGGGFSAVRVDVSSRNNSVPNTVSREAHHQSEQSSEDDEMGQIGLYENPSPVKIASPLKIPVPPQQRSQPSQAILRLRTINNAPAPMADHASETSSTEFTSPTRSESPLADPLSAELEKIQAMISSASRIGFRRGKGGYIFDSNAEVLAKKIYTREGKILKRQLDALAGHYAALRIATDETISQAQLQVTASIKEVRSTIAKIVSNRLTTLSADIEQREQAKAMITDIYFNLILRFIQVARLATRGRNNPESMTDSSIREIIGLFDMIYELSNAVLKQPAEVRPEVSEYKSFQWEQPVKEILSLVQEVKGMFLNRLNLRARAAGRVERERRAQERQEEQGKREYALREAEIRRRAKIRAEYLTKRRNDPTWGRLIKAEEAKIDERQVPKPVAFASHRRINALRGDPENENNEDWELDDDIFEYHSEEDGNDEDQELRDEDVDDIDDPFAGELDYTKVAEGAAEGVERIEIFPRDNVREISRVWSPEERRGFISIMMKEERGYDRYQDAADQLDATLPDIHDLAKELQDLMDREHSNGRMNTTADNWTYHIWDPKNGQ